jgi:hypothetical protein
VTGRDAFASNISTVSYTIAFDPELRALTATACGSPESPNFLQALDLMLADSRYRPGVGVLFDNSALDPTGVTRGEVEAIAHFLRAQAGLIGDTPIASVSPTDLAFGLGRMAQLMADVAGLDIRIFRCAEQARAWLRERLAAGAPARGAVASVSRR